MTTINLKAGLEIEIITNEEMYLVTSAPAPKEICGRERIGYCEAEDFMKRFGKKEELRKFNPMHGFHN